MKNSLDRAAHVVKRWFLNLYPIQQVVLGYLSYIILGWFFLLLPWSQKVKNMSWLDHLFTATSAVSTTGLATMSIADSYTFFGQGIVLFLIQLGGLGYMTLSSFIVLSASGKISSFRHRITSTALSLPQGFEVIRFLRQVIGFTLIIEIIGTWGLYFIFVKEDVPQALWEAIFHSVSAFCTAGFSLFNTSLEAYRNHVGLNCLIIVLSYLGAIGFIVMSDVWTSLKYRKTHITLTSKIILMSTLWISVIGTLLLFFDESSTRSLPFFQRAMTAFFQTMTASTTVGFNTIPIGALTASSLFLLTLIMIIGASPAGTGGGLKTTTFTALWAVMASTFRQQEKITFFKKQIPRARIFSAIASLMFYLFTFIAGVYALTLTEKLPLPDLAFEAASALGTVGLSRGITGNLTNLGKIIITALMFLGRIGPISIGMALFTTREKISDFATEEDIAI
ncbi:MAG: potassium transporter KtrB [Verrucomicrobiae bacterium]|nr:potassium transporter KtrB [Verrucomicrobiae bacterium]